MTTTPLAPSPPPPTVPAAEPSRLWRPTADPHKTVPVVEVDLTRQPLEVPPGVPLGVAVGAFLVTVGSLGFALYSLPRSERDVDLGLALATVAFLTSLVAAFVHLRRSR